MKKILYLILAVLGAVLPLSQFIPASIAGEFSVTGMLQAMTSTRTITGVTLDFLVVVVTSFVFAVPEAIRLKMRWAWVCIAGTFLIGSSFGLPLFLLMREYAMRRKGAGEKSMERPGL
jgi:hypothetical protein